MAEEFEIVNLPLAGALPGIPGIHGPGTIIIHREDGKQERHVITHKQWREKVKEKEKAEREAREKALKDGEVEITGTDQHGNPVTGTVVIDDAVRATAAFIKEARGE